MRRLIWVAPVCALLCALWGAGVAGAAKLTPIGRFEQPIFVTSDPLDPDRVLVAERKGTVVEAGPAGTRQLLDIGALVSCCESERGLLSLAPAPDFDSSGRFYVAYTGTPAAGGAEGDVHVDSFHRQADGQMARDQILVVAHSQNPNHNGGQLQLGPDGHLYVSLGDGGGGGDPDGNAQSTETLLGKVLRIDPQPGMSPSYTIPPGNPFAAGPGRDEIWTYGLRNPWRFSFDRSSGDTVVADVGQDAREEVDFAPSSGGGAIGGAGANYGWNCREGFIPYSGAPSGCGSVGFTDPVFDYPHEDPNGGLHGCSIIGGYVVRDQSVPDLYGRYLYTDYCSEEIRSLALPANAAGRASGDRSEGLSVESPTSFGEDSCGRVYVASGLGPVYRIEGATPAVCLPPEEIAVSTGGRRARIRLRVKSTGARVTLTARVVPCAGQARAKLQLNRGGKKLRVKRLDGRCAARFRLGLRHRSTFRALLPADGAIRSRRVTVRPPHPKPLG